MSQKIYFFGVASPHDLGHYLYRSAGQGHISKVYETEQKDIPFRTTALDGGLLAQPETTRPQLSIVNGWTIVGTWDRTGDKRFASNASFIMEGVHTLEAALAKAASEFPGLYARIYGSTLRAETTNSAPISS